MFMINYVLVFVFVSMTTGFRIDLQNEGKSKSPFYQAINRIRRSEDSKELESEDTGDDMEVAENRFLHQGLHSFLPFPPTQHGYLPGPFPHLGHHQQMFGYSDWQNGNGFGQEGYGHNHQYGYDHGHHKLRPFGWQNVNEFGQEGYGYNHHHNHQPGYGHGHGHGHGHEHGHVHGFGCGHDLNNEFHHHEHNHHKNDKSTPPSVINPSEVTTPSTSTTSEIYDIDVRLGS